MIRGFILSIPQGNRGPQRAPASGPQGLSAEHKEGLVLSLAKRFFKFVLPSIVSMWVFSLYTMADGIFVAQGVGEKALAAVNLSMPMTSAIFAIGLLLATGMSFQPS